MPNKLLDLSLSKTIIPKRHSKVGGAVNVSSSVLPEGGVRLRTVESHSSLSSIIYLSPEEGMDLALIMLLILGVEVQDGED